MTKAQKAERDEAIARLRDWIKPGDTVYTVLDQVSRSGMSRHIRVVLIDKDGNMTHPNHAVGKALGMRHAKRNGHTQDALVVGGCGMDMGFHVVNNLSQVLYGGTLVPDIYKAGHDKRNGITRDGAPEGYVYSGGYRCLGKGKCPSNYHVNHRENIRCEGTRVSNPEGPDTGQFCYAPSPWRNESIPENWPRLKVDIGEGKALEGMPLHCIEPEDGKPEVCPTCKGAGSLPNPEGPERFDLLHTDGYALRHRWI